MYIIFTITIILLILLFYFFELEVNINIISCVIIILLLNSLFYKKTYEKFNNINKLQDEYLRSFYDIRDEYKNRTNLQYEEYKMIPIYSSKFNSEIFDSSYNNVPMECKGIHFNGEYLSGSEFISLLDKLNNKI